MPVMEGKAALFKAFGGVDAFPICLDTRDTDDRRDGHPHAPAFGGINLRTSPPLPFSEIEAAERRDNIPVFHDDQHGTAIVVLSGINHALRLVGREGERCAVVNGGSAGIAIAKRFCSPTASRM